MVPPKDMTSFFNPAAQGTVDERTSLMENESDAEKEPDMVRLIVLVLFFLC